MMIAARKWYVAFIPIFASSVTYAQEQTTAKFGDWTLSCARPSGESMSCGLVQMQRPAGQASPVSQIGIGRNRNSQPLKMTIEIAADAWVPTGARLITSNNAGVSATFKWCVSTRCLADAELSDNDVRTLRAEKEQGKLIYRTAAQADVSIPVSFKGFSEALDAFQKQ